MHSSFSFINIVYFLQISLYYLEIIFEKGK